MPKKKPKADLTSEGQPKSPAVLLSPLQNQLAKGSVAAIVSSINSGSSTKKEESSGKKEQLKNVETKSNNPVAASDSSQSRLNESDLPVQLPEAEGEVFIPSKITPGPKVRSSSFDSLNLAGHSQRFSHGLQDGVPRSPQPSTDSVSKIVPVAISPNAADVSEVVPLPQEYTLNMRPEGEPSHDEPVPLPQVVPGNSDTSTSRAVPLPQSSRSLSFASPSDNQPVPIPFHSKQDPSNVSSSERPVPLPKRQDTSSMSIDSSTDVPVQLPSSSPERLPTMIGIVSPLRSEFMSSPIVSASASKHTVDISPPFSASRSSDSPQASQASTSNPAVRPAVPPGRTSSTRRALFPGPSPASGETKRSDGSRQASDSPGQRRNLSSLSGSNQRAQSNAAGEMKVTPTGEDVETINDSIHRISSVADSHHFQYTQQSLDRVYKQRSTERPVQDDEEKGTDGFADLAVTPTTATATTASTTAVPKPTRHQEKALRDKQRNFFLKYFFAALLGALIITLTGGAGLALITPIVFLQYLFGFGIGSVLGALTYKAISTLFSPRTRSHTLYDQTHKQLGLLGLFTGAMFVAIFGAATFGTGYLLVLAMASAGVVCSYAPYLVKQLLTGFLALGRFFYRCLGFTPNSNSADNTGGGSPPPPPPPVDDAENQRQTLLRPSLHDARLQEAKAQSHLSQSDQKDHRVSRQRSSATSVSGSQSATTSNRFKPRSGSPLVSAPPQRSTENPTNTAPSAPPPSPS